MFLGSPLPTWKQIFTCKKKRAKKTFYEELFSDVFFMAESCMSIRLILNAIRAVAGKSEVRVLLPDYFCNQTIYSFNEEWVKLVFYPIKGDMDPNWDYLKAWTKENEFDVFIFTHYFGKYHANISRAREVCKHHNAILIEDCAHVMYPTGKMGTSGDFVIYSPHKQLPIMDGGVLVCNENGQKTMVAELNNWIRKHYNTLPNASSGFGWYVKKALQKLLPIHRGLTYYAGIHNSTDRGILHEIEKISQGSYNTLCDFKYIDFKRAAYIRRDNLEMMNYIISLRYPNVIALMDSRVDVPYFAVYSLENVKDKEKTAKEMIEAGFTVLYWPDLPYQLNDVVDHDEMKKLSKNVIVLPIHQNLSPQKLAKKFLGGEKQKEFDISLESISQEEYMALYSSLRVNNIPQDWIYGNAKEATEGWNAVRYNIVVNGVISGLVQILEKKKLGMTVAVRINRGPMMDIEHDSASIKLQIMEKIRKKYTHPIPIIYAPYIEMSAKSIHLATIYGWRCLNKFGFPSATVDLSLSEGELHKNMKAFWRKNLNHAKKDVIIRNNEYDTEEIIKLYNQFLKMKNIPGIPEHILRYLFGLPVSPLEVLTAYNKDGVMIAYKVLYKHGNCGTSFIAWNTDEGRAKQARTLLIWSSMLRLKELGYKYFDLGGVDDINTEEVAKYKRGAGGLDYRLAGEFIKF